MKKRTKKILSISGVIFGVGAITTSVALPIALNIGEKSSLDDNKILYWTKDKDGNDVPVMIKDKDGNDVPATVKNVLDLLKRLGQEDRTQLSRFDYYSAFFLYNQQQSKSLELQKMWFEWNIYDFDNQIAEVQNGSAEQKDKDKKIKELRDKQNKEKDKLNVLNKTLAGQGSLNYDSRSFKEDYPKTLLPLEKRREEQQKVYEENKKNFIDKYATRREGEIAWELKRRQDYNDAATDNEAIDSLTNKVVSKEAFGEFTFKINGDYTYEQKWAKVDNHYIFPFLRKAVQKDGLGDDLDSVGFTDRKTKIYFIGSDASDPNKIFLDLENPNETTKNILNKISKQKLVKISHGLLKIKQNENGAALDWSFEGDKENPSNTLLNLLSFYGTSGDQTVLDLLPNVFQNDHDDETDIFINNFSDDPSGKDVRGSLGVRSILDYIKDMEPGFGLGVLANNLNGNNPFPDERQDKNYLNILQTNLKQAKIDVWGNQQPQTQNEVNQRVAALTDQQKAIFARAIKNTFDPESKGLKLFYPAGNATIVFSKFGMHIVKSDDYTDIDVLKNEINKDLKNVANAQDESKSQTKWGDLFSKYFQGNQRRQFIVENFNQNNQLKNYINEKEKERTEAQKRIVWEDIVKSIDSLQNQQQITNVDDAIGDKVNEFYVKGIDKQLLQADKTLLPEDVYRKLLDLIIPSSSGGGKK